MSSFDAANFEETTSTHTHTDLFETTIEETTVNTQTVDQNNDLDKTFSELFASLINDVNDPEVNVLRTEFLNRFISNENNAKKLEDKIVALEDSVFNLTNQLAEKAVYLQELIENKALIPGPIEYPLACVRSC